MKDFIVYEVCKSGSSVELTSASVVLLLRGPAKVTVEKNGEGETKDPLNVGEVLFV